MKRCWLLLLGLVASLSGAASCRSTDGYLLEPVYQKRFRLESRYLTLTLKSVAGTHRFAVMESLNENLAIDSLFTEWGYSANGENVSHSRLQPMSFGSLVLPEDLRTTFNKVSDEDIIHQHLGNEHAKVSGILGRPFLDRFQWQFRQNELRVFKDCDPHFPGGLDTFVFDVDRYDLLHNQKKLAGEIMHAHINSDNHRYDLAVKLTFSPDTSLYMVGNISPGTFRKLIPNVRLMFLERVFISDSAIHGGNELHKLVLTAEKELPGKHQPGSTRMPVMKKAEALLRPGNDDVPSHLELSLFGLSRRLKGEILWFRTDGQTCVRFSDLKTSNIGEPSSDFGVTRRVF
ncbi:hypothetical protein GZ77_11145 [Endozoicomonas montiporae]|uniref:Uncharacterized protein n=2 Tax=Endozoicomonas montiporae TaxID=1027273 RepID=A0A081N8Q2_9GAMM|nr:hypothetical protein [Endozoicomonas montiporae]AMO55271.1 hypothetical protein EZMO1_1067 [Endozoicomonas montiporae CL-33]KEQ14825.1 hypothetical protein GZ77_11145 [Endozoicomonas montiporae]